MQRRAEYRKRTLKSWKSAFAATFLQLRVTQANFYSHCVLEKSPEMVSVFQTKQAVGFSGSATDSNTATLLPALNSDHLDQLEPFSPHKSSLYKVYGQFLICRKP